jgi:hypothetical protein
LIGRTIYLERYFDRLAGRKDIDNALGELEKVFQGEQYTVTAQVLQDTGELRRGAWLYEKTFASR